MDKKKHGTDHSGVSHGNPGPAVDLEAEVVQEGTEAGERVRQLEEALAAKEAEALANWDKFLRERADLENFRKRVQKEKEELVKYGNENLILEILPAIDNLERALAHAGDDSGCGSVIEGVRLTNSLLIASLKKFGVTPIESGNGPFDPCFHQAMSKVESADHEPNTIVDEFQKGYLLHGRLLRPAMVSVAVSPKKNAE